MRKRFEQQYSLGLLKIEDTEVDLKSRDSFSKLILALKMMYVDSDYNNKLMRILEDKIIGNKQKTGRIGLNLWQIFVLAQTRLALNISYDRLHDLVNNHRTLRQILGIENILGHERITIEYQNIADNVKLLNDNTLKQINEVIIQMGHDVFKKKEEEALRLKTDSFVVLSNIHFPTDYNLLWDSARSSITNMKKAVKKHNIKGWRKINNWHKELKSLMREITLSSKKSKENQKIIVLKYLKKANLLSEKLHFTIKNLPLEDNKDLLIIYNLEYYMSMLDKHIDLLKRRIVKGEKIPHNEKIFSIFEPYTEWNTKGKRNPSVEFGKNTQVTTDQYHLIIDHQIMENITDSEIVIDLSDRLLCKYNIKSWSFDKGYFSKENKELLSLFVENLIMPKKGKLNKKEYQEEHKKEFKQLRNKHSAVESNINELGYRGLDRCPDRSYSHFKNYIALGICAYNLHKIGAELLRQERLKQKFKKAA